MSDSAFQDLENAIERLLNVEGALNLPLPDQIHVVALRGCIPSVITNLKAAYVKLTGENPWE